MGICDGGDPGVTNRQTSSRETGRRRKKFGRVWCRRRQGKSCLTLELDEYVSPSSAWGPPRESCVSALGPASGVCGVCTSCEHSWVGV